MISSAHFGIVPNGVLKCMDNMPKLPTYRKTSHWFRYLMRKNICHLHWVAFGRDYWFINKRQFTVVLADFSRQTNGQQAENCIERTTSREPRPVDLHRDQHIPWILRPIIYWSFTCKACFCLSLILTHSPNSLLRFLPMFASSGDLSHREIRRFLHFKNKGDEYPFP